MPVEFKDYYATLGVAREATPEDIKQAFRKLARKYHPDVAKDKRNAEEKFKEINEANEVLSDPEKRKKYNELGANWQDGGRGPAPSGRPGTEGAPGAGAGPEFHFNGTGFSDFFEQFFSGSGHPGFAGGARGFGAQDGGPEHGADIEGDILVSLHEAMHGATRSISLRTTDPRTGEEGTHSFSVRIPPGAVEGRRIRVPGKGGPGAGGGTPGDLYLRVRHAAHPDFRARGADLYHDLPLAPWEAVLGASIAAPTLDGAIKLRIPAGTNPGAQLRVRGQGLPTGTAGERGDLYYVASLQLPAAPDAAERALWEKLRDASTFDPRSSSRKS